MFSKNTIESLQSVGVTFTPTTMADLKATYPLGMEYASVLITVLARTDLGFEPNETIQISDYMHDALAKSNTAMPYEVFGHFIHLMHQYAIKDYELSGFQIGQENQPSLESIKDGIIETFADKRIPFINECVRGGVHPDPMGTDRLNAASVPFLVFKVGELNAKYPRARALGDSFLEMSDMEVTEEDPNEVVNIPQRLQIIFSQVEKEVDLGKIHQLFNEAFEFSRDVFIKVVTDDAIRMPSFESVVTREEFMKRVSPVVGL